MARGVTWRCEGTGARARQHESQAALTRCERTSHPDRRAIGKRVDLSKRTQTKNGQGCCSSYQWRARRRRQQVGVNVIGYSIDRGRVTNTSWRRCAGGLVADGAWNRRRRHWKLREEPGLRALRDIAVNEASEMPRRLSRHLHADASNAAALWNTAWHFLPPAFLKLALLILHEARGGDEALFHPYTQLLPTADDMAFEGGPAWIWSHAELEATECEKMIEDAAAKWQTAVIGHEVVEPSQFASRWRASLLPGEPPTDHELAWAVATVTTRWLASAVLVPVFDMANHADTPNTELGFGPDGALRLTARSPIAQGDQVFYAYQTPLSSFQALMLYGFVSSEPHLPREIIFVRVTPLTAEDRPTTALVQQLDGWRRRDC